MKRGIIVIIALVGNVVRLAIQTMISDGKIDLIPGDIVQKQ